MRRAGPEWAAAKKTSNGRESRATSSCFPCKSALETRGQARVYTPGEMWEWYRIGLSLGLGIGLGSLLPAVLAPRRVALISATGAVAIAAGAGIGYAIGGWHEALAGGLGGGLAAVVAARLVLGTLERGGTRGGTAALVGLGALVLAALALVPAVGYLEAVALPALAARARGRRVDRVAGLRSLARD